MSLTGPFLSIGKHYIEEIERVFALCKKYRIETVGYFLIGSPDERRKKDVLNTINFALKLNPDYSMFNILIVYPKTALFSKALKDGIIESAYWQKYISAPYRGFQLPFWSENLNRRQLTGLLNYAYRRFYFRPGFILRKLKS